MLISMPTGTSTIFGVFQAILALLVKPDELRPMHKIVANENFASEIFGHNPMFYVAAQQDFTTLCDSVQNKAGPTCSEYLPSMACRRRFDRACPKGG